MNLLIAILLIVLILVLIMIFNELVSLKKLFMMFLFGDDTTPQVDENQEKNDKRE